MNNINFCDMNYNNKRKQNKPENIKQIIKEGIAKIKKMIPNVNDDIADMFLNHLIPVVGIKENEINLDKINKNMNDFINSNIYNMDKLINKYTLELTNQINNCPCRR